MQSELVVLCVSYIVATIYTHFSNKTQGIQQVRLTLTLQSTESCVYSSNLPKRLFKEEFNSPKLEPGLDMNFLFTCHCGWWI